MASFKKNDCRQCPIGGILYRRMMITEGKNKKDSPMLFRRVALLVQQASESLPVSQTKTKATVSNTKRLAC